MNRQEGAPVCEVELENFLSSVHDTGECGVLGKGNLMVTKERTSKRQEDLSSFLETWGPSKSIWALYQTDR